MYANIVFMQDEEAYGVLDALYNVVDYVVLGATEESVNRAFEYLAQWDYGDYSEVSDEPHHVKVDDTWTQGPFILSANRRIGYVGLERRLD